MIIIIIIILFYPIAFTLVELINSLLFVPCFVTDLCKDYLPTPPLISLSISFGRSVGLRRPMREEKVAVRGRWRPLAFVLALSSSALWFSPCSSSSASPFVRVLFFSWFSILSISLAFSSFSFALLSSRSFIHLHRHLLLNLLSPSSSVCS